MWVEKIWSQGDLLGEKYQDYIIKEYPGATLEDKYLDRYEQVKEMIARLEAEREHLLREIREASESSEIFIGRL